MIVVENLYFTYAPQGDYVLKNINLEIGEGELIAIMGDNGAGKTTLVKHFNGLLKPTLGRVYVDDVDTRDVPISELSRKVGMIFQYPEKMFFSERVWDEVAFALRNFGYDEASINRLVQKILNIFWLWKYRDSSPFILSGGEQRRLAIASVLVWNPKYVVMDEPTAGQDAVQREILLQIINMMVSQGKTVILVTHDVEFVAEIRPRVILMSNGEVVYDGEATRLFRNPGILESAGLTQPILFKLESRLRDQGLIEGGFNTIDEAAKKIISLLGDERL
jgi:energy-coupling factor transport system ATP-binding protein